MEKIVLLSYPVSIKTPLYGSAPLLEIKPHTSIMNGHTADSAILKMHNHSSTHIDFPAHFILGGKNLLDYESDDSLLHFDYPILLNLPMGDGELIRTALLAQYENEISNADLLLIKTGFCNMRNDEKYKTHNPGIAKDAFIYLRKNFKSLRAIGIDSISISSFQHREEGRRAHREAFRDDPAYGDPLIVIEDVNLSNPGKYNRVIVVPFFSASIDASPVTMLGICNSE